MPNTPSSRRRPLYKILYLDQRKAVVLTTIRALRNKKKKVAYRYIPVLNPLPFEEGDRVQVTIELISD